MKQSFKRCGSISVVAILLILTVSLSGCVGYNKLMRDYLSDPDNYYEFEIEITRLYFYDGDKQYEERYTDITCSSDVDMSTADTFYIVGKVLRGNSPSINDDCYAQHIELDFELSQANVLHLLSTDFYDDVKVGDKINVRSTLWVYGDREWRYVAEITFDGETYLNFDEGLQNIVDFINANKSLF